MKIKILTLELLNFKGIKSLVVNFDDQTEISGANGTGKSTIFDAFTFLLFGKNQFDQKDFSVKTWDQNGVIIPKIEHGVTGILTVDGKEVKLSRTIKEKWVKPRGAEEAEFQGNETVYFINDIPKQQREYQEYINDIIPEATFKLLTSPYNYNSLPWETRRKMLTSIAGEPTEEEIAGTDLVDVLSTIREEKETIENLKKKYAAKKKNLKEALSQIPSRIDEVTRNTPESEDFAAIEKQVAEKKAEIEKVDTEITDRSKGVEELIRKRSDLLIEKNNIQTRIQHLENEAKSQSGQQSNKRTYAITEATQKIESLKRSISSYQGEINFNNERIKTLEEKNAVLRDEWTKLNATTFSWTGSSNCPTCGTAFADEIIESKKTDAESKFNAEKSANQKRINESGLSNKQLIEKLASENESLQKQIDEASTGIVECENLIKDLKSTPIEEQSFESYLTPEYSELKSKLETIVIPEAIQVNTDDLQQRKREINSEINELTAKLNKKAVIESMTNRKNELLAEEKNLASQIAQLEKFEYKLDQFGRRKAQEVENRVNKLFPTVRFRMFNIQINGAEDPTCETLINGVPFSDVNHAGQINAGVEIINVFSDIHDKYCPVFVDNSEACNNIIPTDSQLIKLRVTTEPSLTINGVPANKHQFATA